MPLQKSSRFSIERTEYVPRLAIVHHVDERGLWGTQNNKIVFRGHGQAKWETLARLPLRLPLDLGLISRLLVRGLRLDRINLFPTSQGMLLAIRNGVVYRVKDKRPEPLFTMQGRVLQQGFAETANHNVYFGEYFTNKQRVSVNIWRVKSDLSAWEIAYTFAEHSIRHVHGIFQDLYLPQRLWIPTGDFENECYLYYTDDEFKNIQRIGDGTQLWRAVHLFFTETQVIWLTDSELEQNYVVALNRATGQLEKHGEVDAPGWYGAQISDGYFVTTTSVEPGASVGSNEARVLVSANGLDWEVVAAYPKDKYPYFFKYGTLSLPTGRFAGDHVWISGEGVEGLDGNSACFRIVDKSRNV